MPGRAAHFPQPLVRVAPVLQGRLHLPLDHRPAALAEPVPGPGVQPHGAEQHAPGVSTAATITEAISGWPPSPWPLQARGLRRLPGLFA